MNAEDRDRELPRHCSGHVWCPRRHALALINSVERPRLPRSVVWCSLRGAAQWCGEECGAPRDPSARE
jgi:hypothetical protein